MARRHASALVPLTLLVLRACTSVAPPYARLELPRRGGTQQDDWLVGERAPLNTTARLLQLNRATVALSNGLVARVFTLSPEWSTWDIVSAGRGSALRAPAPEAVVTLDAREYAVGGLALDTNASAGFASCKHSSRDNWYPAGQQAQACPTGWWNRSLPLLGPDAKGFRYASHTISAPAAPFPWRPARHAPHTAWPPLGLHLAVNFTAPPSAPPEHSRVIITVHYELLDGVPLISKWVSVHLPPSAAEPSRRHTAATRADGPLEGALSLQPCDTNPAVAPAEWGFVWDLPQPAATNATIQLGGKNSARKVCMSVVTAPTDYSNADVGLRPCNASDPMQDWAWDRSSTGALRTLAPPAMLLAANIRGCQTNISAPACCKNPHGAGHPLNHHLCLLDSQGRFLPDS
jgi:hypothetical protein